jgi:hypothetical protein
VKFEGGGVIESDYENKAMCVFDIKSILSFNSVSGHDEFIVTNLIPACPIDGQVPEADRSAVTRPETKHRDGPVKVHV